jgi:flagellar hook-associated protein 2
MAIQLTGLAGGLDSSSIVSQLVAVAQQPVDDLTSKKGLVDSATVTMNSFSTKLATLQSAATALSTSSGFVSMSATSSDTSIVGSVTGSAAAGSYSVNVTQLATAQKMRSDAQTSSTTALGQSGTLTLNIGTGTPLTINVSATDTLTDIAANINRSGGRVSAGIINAGGSYRLSLQGLDTGASNAMTVTEGGTINLGLSNPANVYQPAQDAKLTVDGLPITRSTNSVADAIPGVTMALTKVTTTPTTVTVASDSTALTQKLTSFVNAYNDIVNSAHSATGYGTAKASNSVLAGDTTIRRALDKISSLVTGAVPGATGNYRSFAAVGLATSKDGTMSLDTTKLNDALSKDPNSVARLFVTDTSSGSTGLMKTLGDTLTQLTSTNGAITTRITALGAQSKSISTSVDQKQKQVDDYEAGLKKQFADLDQAMSKYNSMSSSLNAITNVSG